MRMLLPLFFAASAPASLSRFASDSRIETRVDARIRVTVAAIYDSLDREGITGEPLIQYALEGTEKRGNPELILAGVRRWAKDLRRSRRILGPGATPNEISSGAKALRAGMSEKQLQGVRAAKGDQRFASVRPVAQLPRGASRSVVLVLAFRPQQVAQPRLDHFLASYPVHGISQEPIRRHERIVGT